MAVNMAKPTDPEPFSFLDGSGLFELLKRGAKSVQLQLLESQKYSQYLSARQWLPSAFQNQKSSEEEQRSCEPPIKKEKAFREAESSSAHVSVASEPHLEHQDLEESRTDSFRWKVNTKYPPLLAPELEAHPTQQERKRNTSSPNPYASTFIDTSSSSYSSDKHFPNLYLLYSYAGTKPNSSLNSVLNPIYKSKEDFEVHLSAVETQGSVDRRSSPCLLAPCNGLDPESVYDTDEDYLVHLWEGKHFMPSDWGPARECLYEVCPSHKRNCPKNSCPGKCIKFSTLNSWLTHVRNVHRKSYYCYYPDCQYRFDGPTPKPFGSQSALNRHLLSKSHSAPVYCDKPGCTGKDNLSREDRRAKNNLYYHGHFLCSVLDCPRGRRVGDVYYGFATHEDLVSHQQQKHQTHPLTEPFSAKAKTPSDDSLEIESSGRGRQHNPGRSAEADMKEPQLKLESPIPFQPTRSKDLPQAVEIESSFARPSTTTPHVGSSNPRNSVGNMSLEMEICHESGDTFESADAGPLSSAVSLPCEREQSCDDIIQNYAKKSLSYMRSDGNEEVQRDRFVEQHEIETSMEASSNGYSTDSETWTEEEYDCDQDSLRKAVMDRIMDRFWVAFRRYFAPGTIEYAGASPSSASEMPTKSPVIYKQQASKGSRQKRPRERGEGEKNEDDDDDDDDEEAPPPKKKIAGPRESEAPLFACPFGKKDPTKYNITDHSSCAKTPRDINRLKQHIYRHHKAPPHCDRCWQVFVTVEELKGHKNVPKANVCELIEGFPPEGWNAENIEKLRTKAKRYKGQEDESRWYDIYQLLFPGAPIPSSPYFELPVEQRARSPDAEVLQNHTSHLQSEVPTLFRAEVERLLPSIVESFDIEAVLRTCIEQAASIYRSGSSNLRMPEPAQSVQGVTETAVTSTGPVARVPVVQHQESGALPEPSFLDTVQPPPPQHDSRMVDPAFERAAQEGRVRLPAEVFSDSGFASGNNYGCVGTCSCGYGGTRQLATSAELLLSNQPSSQSNFRTNRRGDDLFSSGTSTAGVALGQVDSDTSIHERSSFDISIEAAPLQDRLDEPDHEGMTGIRDWSGTGLNDDDFNLSWWDDFVREARPDSLW